MLDAFVFEPFSVNQSLVDSLLLESDSFEVYVAPAATGPLSGSGTIGDPYLVSSAQDFDNLLASFAPYTTIHLAPGTYTTQGHADGQTTGWQPRRGQRIVGAGIDLTILQLSVSNPQANAIYFAVGADDAALISQFELSDVTLDCNQGAAAHSNIATGAVKVHGSHTLLQRLRAINFGSRSQIQRGVVFDTAGANPDYPDPFDCVVQACVVEQPFPSSLRETVCISLTANERQTDGVMAYHKGCVVRDCFVDCQYVANDIPIDNITHSAAVATVTTKLNHNLSNNPWVVITGALVNSDPSNPYNGSFQISVVDATHFTYTMASSPSQNPTGDMWLGKYPSQVVAIQGVAVQALGGNQYKVKLTTVGPHLRTMNDNVVVSNLTEGGTLSTLLNGVFPISDIGDGNTDPTILKYIVTSGTAPNPDASQPNAFIGVAFYGIAASGGIGAILDSNRIFSARFGVFADSLSTKDLVIRDNHFYGVVRAVQQALGGLSTNGGVRRGGSIIAAGTTATFTTNLPHGFAANQAVNIQGADQTAYNGTYPIQSVPAPNQFTYLMTGSPSTPATGTITFAGLWQVGRLIIESNVMELLLSVLSNTDGHSSGVWLGGSDRAAPYVFRQVVFRENVVRHVGGASGSTVTRALELDSCENAIVETNVIQLDRAQAIEFTACGAVKFFNNQAPSGALIQGYDLNGAQYVNELTTDADLAAILAT